jgi:hypothetical protein
MLLVPAVMSRQYTGYRVELASGAWRQVASLDREAFQRLMVALRQLAMHPSVEMESGTQARLTAGGLTALYQLDHAASTVLVVDLIRASGDPSFPTSSPVTPGTGVRS